MNAGKLECYIAAAWLWPLSLFVGSFPAAVWAPGLNAVWVQLLQHCRLYSFLACAVYCVPGHYCYRGCTAGGALFCRILGAVPEHSQDISQLDHHGRPDFPRRQWPRQGRDQVNRSPVLGLTRPDSLLFYSSLEQFSAC